MRAASRIPNRARQLIKSMQIVEEKKGKKYFDIKMIGA